VARASIIWLAGIILTDVFHRPLPLGPHPDKEHGRSFPNLAMWRLNNSVMVYSVCDWILEFNGAFSTKQSHLTQPL